MKEFVFCRANAKYHGGVTRPTTFSPIGVIQIMCDMGENVARYEEFSQFLADNGYLVFCFAPPQKIYKDFCHTNIYDCIKIARFFRTKYKCPLFLVGHNAGTFVTQHIIAKTNICDAGIYITNISGGAGKSWWLFRCVSDNCMQIFRKKLPQVDNMPPLLIISDDYDLSKRPEYAITVLQKTYNLHHTNKLSFIIQQSHITDRQATDNLGHNWNDIITFLHRAGNHIPAPEQISANL